MFLSNIRMVAGRQFLCTTHRLFYLYWKRYQWLWWKIMPHNLCFEIRDLYGMGMVGTHRFCGNPIGMEARLRHSCRDRNKCRRTPVYGKITLDSCYATVLHLQQQKRICLWFISDPNPTTVKSQAPALIFMNCQPYMFIRCELIFDIQELSAIHIH